MNVDIEAASEVAQVISDMVSVADATHTLQTGDAPTLTALAAVNTLASQAIPDSFPGTQAALGTFGLAFSAADVAANASDGEFTVHDVAAASAAIGAALALSLIHI